MKSKRLIGKFNRNLLLDKTFKGPEYVWEDLDDTWSLVYKEDK